MAFEDNLMTFIDHYKSTLEAKQNGEEGVHKEFAQLKSLTNKLKQEKKYAATAGEKSCNTKKNRYKDILPFDSTRFILKTTESNPEDGSDYINANYIEGTKDVHAYIAAQGPLPSTVNDFWRLLWECGGNIIIMACNEYEMGKNKAKQHKCERYWAEEGEEKTFGEITVSLIDSEISKRDFCLRQLKAKKGNEEKLFHQFHYTAWPDHGVPDTVTSILELVRKARELQPSENKPLIVHCSAGCGRTGTIIVLDYVTELLKSQKISADFSLYNIIFNMRRQRPAIVQTKEQYEFVHKAVSELFKHELNNLGVDYGHNYENVQIGVPLTENTPRRPPTLPNTQVKSKPGATPKPASRATAPAGKSDPTVYANAEDLKTRPNSSPAVVSVTPRERSSKDIKIMDEVQKSVTDKHKEDHPVKSAKPKIGGKPNKSNERRVSGGPTARELDKNSLTSSQEGGKQSAQSSSGTGKQAVTIKLPSSIPPGNLKPSGAPGKGMSPSLADRMGNLNVNHLVHSTTNSGKVASPVRDSNRPTMPPPKPPPSAKGNTLKGSSAAATINDLNKRALNNVTGDKGNQAYEDVSPDPSTRAPLKPPAVWPPPSPGGTRTKPKPAAKDGGWANNVVYNKGATGYNSNFGSGAQTNVAYQGFDANPPVKSSEYEVVGSSGNSKKDVTHTESSSSPYEDISLNFKPPPPRITKAFNSRDNMEDAGNSHHGALRPPSHNRSSITSIKSNASTGSREDSPSRDSGNYDQGVVAPIVPARTAESYQLIDDLNSPHNEQEEKSENRFTTLKGLITKRRPRNPFHTPNDSSTSSQGNTAVVQQLGQTNHHSGVPDFPKRVQKPVGPRPLPQQGGRGMRRPLPT